MAVDVYLRPKAFLDDLGVSFKKGDEINLTGPKIAPTILSGCES